MTFIKGKHSVYEALQANATIHYINITQTISSDIPHIINLAKQRKIPVQIISPKEFLQRYKMKDHQNIMAKK